MVSSTKMINNLTEIHHNQIVTKVKFLATTQIPVEEKTDEEEEEEEEEDEGEEDEDEEEEEDEDEEDDENEEEKEEDENKDNLIAEEFEKIPIDKFIMGFELILKVCYLLLSVCLKNNSPSFCTKLRSTKTIPIC